MNAKKQGMELWRPDWPEIYRGSSRHPVMPDVAGELLTVTRETLRLALSAIEYQQSQDGYHNFSAAAAEIRRVLDRQ